MEKMMLSIFGSRRNGQWLKEQEKCVAQWKWEGIKNPKSVWLSDHIKAVVRRKGAASKMLAASDEEGNERCTETYREEKRR